MAVAAVSGAEPPREPSGVDSSFRGLVSRPQSRTPQGSGADDLFLIRLFIPMCCVEPQPPKTVKRAWDSHGADPDHFAKWLNCCSQSGLCPTDCGSYSKHSAFPVCVVWS